MNFLQASIRDLFCGLAASSSDLAEGLMILDGTGEILFCNDSLLRIFDLKLSPRGRWFSEVFGKERRPHGAVYPRRFYDAVTNAEKSLSTTVSLEKPGGDEHYYLLLLSALGEDGKVTLCLLKEREKPFSASPGGADREEEEGSLHAQVSELVRSNAQLRMANAERNAIAQTLRRMESRYRDIFDNAIEGIFQWTPDWRLLSANTSFARMMGYGTVNALMQTAEDISFHFSLSPERGHTLVAELERKGHIIDYEFQMVRHDGTMLWASMNARCVAGQGGRTKYYEAFIENISDRKITEEKLVYQAFHDPLTGLANRALFQDRLCMALRRAARQPDYHFAVLSLDLDRFKMVNDIFGYGAGDDVLCHTASNLLSCVREIDTVARLGGDEFVILLEETERNSFAVRVAKRISATISRPFHVNEQEVNIGASIGIVLKAEKYDLPEDILRDADIAMYRVKADRGVRYKVFTQKMRVETIESIIFETELRQALHTREFHLNYQPIVDMNSGRLFGFEALLRWRRKGETVSPNYFIPVAEETGFIRSLGLYALEVVCQQIMDWKRRYDITFATHLNISARQLIFPGFPKEVRRVLERTGLDPALLVFEITESVLLDNGGAWLQGMQNIREFGIHFCLDDFGTGFSSLSYLRQLPLSSMKMDRSFVAEVETDRQALIIVRDLVGLGNDLGLAVVAEGVERQTQVTALLAAGCTLAQGYLFSHPVPASEVEGLFQSL